MTVPSSSSPDTPPTDTNDDHAIIESSGMENEAPPNNNEASTTVTSGETFTMPPSEAPPPSGIRCRCFPHGIYVVLPAIFATFAWLSSLSQDGCDYARLTGPIDIPFLDVGFNQYREPLQHPTEGTWYVDYRLNCDPYNTDVVNIGGVWSFSKVMAFLSLVFGGGGSLFLWFSTCFIFTKGTWRWAGCELVAATVCQSLSFVWFKVDMCHGNDGQDKCELNYGSKANILASVFWLASVVCIFGKYPKAKTIATEAGGARSDTEGTSDRAAVPTELEMVEQPELPLEGQVQPPTS
ncbi:predicted protein [Thalassiosira pseudonana CCMP1335]|uniref:Uncharacterized protein n=1 Tax=Thalassiosira pseudonana TaxID=35128 RepID=B8BYP9_THAPS|nr:predicted protein [Thalassiosira pseudonana CCMP1335]EED94413.1 predicted protein [Thalassiosira pseudonana CCMP1335]